MRSRNEQPTPLPAELPPRDPPRGLPHASAKQPQAPDLLPGCGVGSRRVADFGRVSEETRFQVAQVVGTGIDTMPAVAQALGTTKTTASHALRHLTDDGYVERRRFEGGAVLYSYSLVKMPPPPKRKRGRNIAAAQPAFVPDTRSTFTTTALEACLRPPALPEGRLVVVHRLGVE